MTTLERWAAIVGFVAVVLYLAVVLRKGSIF